MDAERRRECFEAFAVVLLACVFVAGYSHLRWTALLPIIGSKPLTKIPLPLPTQFFLDIRHLSFIAPPAAAALLLWARARPLALVCATSACWLFSLGWPLLSIIAWYGPYAH